MDAPQIVALLTKLGFRRVRTAPRWVVAECPFTERHGGGYDKHPSFNVHIAPTRSSKYNCQGGSCRAWGDNLLSLVWRMAIRNSTPGHDRYTSLMDWVIK